MTGRSSIGAAIMAMLGLLAAFGQPAVRPLSSPASGLFADVTTAAGLDFRHFTGGTGNYYLPEIMGSGCALFDYDGDGDLDLFLVQGMELDGRRPSAGVSAPRRPGHRLYRNELVPSGRFRLTDVSLRSGLNRESYGMGTAVGDIDGDGDLDLFVSGFGTDLLFRNNGDGTFTETARAAGVDDPRWSTSSAFVDYDRDGDLDLYVANYVDFTVRGNKRCTAPTGEPDYCTPAAYRPQTDILYRNDGTGSFTDVTRESGIGAVAGPGLGVTCADFNGDGLVDIYVANDGAANLLWLNRGDGTFTENGLLSGSAYAMSGMPRAGMGAAAGDYDNDGDPDLLVTNLTREGFTLFRSNGRGLFDDISDAVDITRHSFLSTGFGVGWIDYDNDGWLDLFAANGAVTIIQALKGNGYPFNQPNQLFHNEEQGRRFREVTAAEDPTLRTSEVSRGAAFGDLDNDGDLDILLSNNRGPARVLLNQSGSRRHWLTVRAQSPTRNRHAVGAIVTLRRPGGAPALTRVVHADGSYLSSGDLRVSFGLGSSPTVESLTITWPDGEVETLRQPPVDRILTVSRPARGR